MIESALSLFRIDDVFGAGGTGNVWRAQDPRLGREVALKVLLVEFVQDPHRLAGPGGAQ